MKVLTIRPVQVKAEPEDRPKNCPHCGSIYLHRHGYSTKPVKDPQVKQVLTVRYKGAPCNRTFRHYPAGVTRADQSRRLVVLAAVAWASDLSTRAIQWLFDNFWGRHRQINGLFDPSQKVQGPLYRLRQFILRLSQNWARYRLWLVEPGVPTTNNLTEQAIGKLKMRGRTVRGFKAFSGFESALLLTCAKLG